MMRSGRTCPAGRSSAIHVDHVRATRRHGGPAGSPVPRAGRPETAGATEAWKSKVSIAAQEFDAEGGLTLGQPSRLSCPLCGGVLNEVLEEGTARFRCQTGHAFTSEGLARGPGRGTGAGAGERRCARSATA